MAFTYIDNQNSLDALVDHLQSTPRVAADIEANSLYNYYQKVCLLQIGSHNACFVVDPLADVDMAPLLDLLVDTPLLFHAGDYDLRMLRRSYSFAPQRPVFDTMIAAQLLGCEELGLVAVVERFLGVPLSKHGQKSDWTRRPLTQKQLEYACDDIRYLEELAVKMEAELRQLGRLEWHTESCARMVAATADVDIVADEDDDPWRIRGAGLLSARELAYLREFWQWRDVEAARADKPPFKILGNQQLINLAKWAATQPDAEIEQAPDVPRRISASRMRTLKAALKKARGLSRKDWPERRKRRDNGEDFRDYRPVLEAMQKECAAVARDLKIPPSVLAPRATLQAIAREHATTPEAMRQCSAIMDWQLELLAPRLQTVLDNGHHPQR